MNRNTRRSLVMLVAAPIVAGGLFMTAAPAQAAVGDASCSNSMAMPQSKAPTGSPSVMTRAGQLGAGAPTASSDAVMGSGCSTASHG